MAEEPFSGKAVKEGLFGEARLEPDLNGEEGPSRGRAMPAGGAANMGISLTVSWTERRLWWPHGMSEKEGLGRVTGARVDRPRGLGRGIEISFYMVGSHEASEWRSTVV